MKNVEIYLPSAEVVQEFVETLTPLEGDFELVSPGTILDARSLMGIFGFDLTKPVTLKIYQPSPENMAAIKPFLAK